MDKLTTVQENRLLKDYFGVIKGDSRKGQENLYKFYGL